MKEINQNQIQEVNGGYHGDNGCIPFPITFPKPTPWPVVGSSNLPF